MRLVRFGERGMERPGALDGEGSIRDLSSVVSDIDGSTLGKQQLERIRALDLTKLPLAPANVRLGTCVGAIPNVLCIGLNYSDHAAETNSTIPSQPIVFNKHTSAISGPNDPVICPPGSLQLDWEVELGVAIGERCWHVEEDDAFDYVAGYFLANDVSERAYQIEMEGQWTKGKSYYSFAPMGPYLVTADEIPDPQDIALWLDVNGKRRQTGSTRTMVYGVRTIVAYLSRFMPLLPGDVILTGTPPGVGLGQKPPVFLHAGDIITLGGAGLGEQRQEVLAYDAQRGQNWSRGGF
jgi:2,4-diketo-3-deoxy-L-fuconate hydrolase